MKKIKGPREPKKFDFPRLSLLIGKQTGIVESGRIVWPDGSGDFSAPLRLWGHKCRGPYGACWAYSWDPPSEACVPSYALHARNKMFEYVQTKYPDYDLVYAGEIR